MRLHPRASTVRWKSEHCWIYDHPRANKVYAHGFLFPSEVTRVREEVTAFMRRVREAIGMRSPRFTSRENDAETTLVDRTLTGLDVTDETDTDTGPNSGTRDVMPTVSGTTADNWYSDSHRAWFARSTVSVFGGRYVSPVDGRNDGKDGMKWVVEGLVEGSTMSRLVQCACLVPRQCSSDTNLLLAADRVTPEQAYHAREPRIERYEGRRVGGTIAVHFIKHASWYLETALAFLGEDEGTDSSLISS